MNQVTRSDIFSVDDIRILFLNQDRLNQFYSGFGESLEDFSNHPTERLEQIIRPTDRLVLAPMWGESTDHFLPSLRDLALDPAVYCFSVRPEHQEMQYPALPFGGQAPQRQMFVRPSQNSMYCLGSLP